MGISIGAEAKRTMHWNGAFLLPKNFLNPSHRYSFPINPYSARLNALKKPVFHFWHGLCFM
ncbi:hypothetical protein [Buttiauxella sp. 3AFRM03]|jgi:hypothetical protein|uniref:hypothetical protein n=1 Tax=Buttiauxella sp. 3AFRM03 TaxID=2479367 RepID=UPI00139010D1|nr:hypothetical protein [Buttiauxella sp. 3AFRM03]